MENNLKIRILKAIGLTAGIFILLLVIANFNYFWKNFNYDLYGVKPSGQPAVTAGNNQPKSAPNFLSIPSLGIAAPIMYADQLNEKSFQAALLNGVVHYPGTADPGQLGNCYIFGHSSDYIWSKGHYKTVFALLPRIKIGDEITVSDNQGNNFTYTVKSTAIVLPSDTKYLQQDYSKKILTVQTSWPVGTALERFLAIAEIKN